MKEEIINSILAQNLYAWIPILLCILLSIAAFLCHSRRLIVKGNIKTDEEAISGYRPSKLRVIHDLSTDEKSQLISSMKKFLEKWDIAAGEQLEIPFIPEEDQEYPDLTHDGEEPEAGEAPEDDHYELRDLMSGELRV